LETVLSYCDKNNRELQTVNLMAQRNVPVTFVPQAAPATPNDSSAGSNDAPAVEAKSKPAPAGSTTSSQSKGALSPRSSKLQDKKTQQREHGKLKPFKEGRALTHPPAATAANVTEAGPLVWRTTSLETTGLNG
jgi:hypothetical protein